MSLLMLVMGVAQAAENYPGVGRPATQTEIQAWDIDVRADFKGLPSGAGSVRRGEEVWEAQCASCHGTFGESNTVSPPIAGGTTRLDIQKGHVAAWQQPDQARTTLMRLSRLSTLWDYIRRAMPWQAPKSLTGDEVYAVTAYILYLGNIVEQDLVLSEKNIAEVQKRLPNRNGMIWARGLWDLKGNPDVRNTACMSDCDVESKLASQLPDSARALQGNMADQGRLVGGARGTQTVTEK